MEFDVHEYSRRLELIAQTKEVEELRAAVMYALLGVGIEGAYFLAPLTADPRIGRLLTSIGLPLTWERHYRARLHLVDPLPTYSLRRAGGFVWPEDLDEDSLTAKERHYLDIAAKFGMARGIGVACFGPNGRAGFLGTAWKCPEPPSVGIAQAVQMIGQSSFQHYCTMVQMPHDVQSLSNRELEVLSWMREGKSNTVIAQILDISRATVDMYVKRIFSKLGVTDRTGAVLRGYSLGLIVSNEYEELIEQARTRTLGISI